MSVDFLPIEAAHAALLAGMHRICFTEPWDEKAMRELLAMPGTYGFLAAEAGKLPRGFIMCRTAGDEAEVLTLMVLPTHRRKGLAQGLLDHGMTEAAAGGAAVIFLEVAADNEAGRALYSAMGFEQVGCRPHYYGNVIDALVMRRPLATIA
ncbi:GNAT family N-acetyltransferase [Telmatospirillum siberiense]|uniref:GNAT family N-acetyltransferase n=2 Tax=Telmatospirillum siberiense TaxID=382514 RepID=A0A2N3PSD7_9PROT|nr:GNAT family N-acetyltransferase [Telmatospirillum siberiense]